MITCEIRSPLIISIPTAPFTRPCEARILQFFPYARNGSSPFARVLTAHRLPMSGSDPHLFAMSGSAPHRLPTSLFLAVCPCPLTAHRLPMSGSGSHLGVELPKPSRIWLLVWRRRVSSMASRSSFLRRIPARRSDSCWSICRRRSSTWDGAGQVRRGQRRSYEGRRRLASVVDSWSGEREHA